MTRPTFAAALDRVRRAYVLGLTGDDRRWVNQHTADTAGYGTPHEEAAEALGWRDRRQGRAPLPGAFASGVPHWRHDPARAVEGAP